MTKEQPDSKSKMIQSAAQLISERGLNATSFSDVLAHSGAPRGSIYYHFPQGKAQLAAEAIEFTAQRVLAYQHTCQATSPAEVLNHFFVPWRQLVQASNAQAGCMIAGTTLDLGAGETELLAAARAGFRSWTDLLAQQLEGTGLPPQRAKAVAVTALAGMEGALILCRAEGHSAPLEMVAAELLVAYGESRQ